MWTLRRAAPFVPLLIFVAIAQLYVRYGVLNADEGFYSAAARRAMEGAIPYRDFAYSQGPVLPYWNGPLLSVVGFGVFAQRGVNAFWGLCTVALVVAALRRRHGVLVAALAGSALAASPYWVHYVSLGKAYAAAGLLLAAAAAVLLSPWSYSRRAWICGVCAAAAVGCRVSVAPAAILLVLHLALWGDTRRRLLPVACFVAACCVFFLPFAFAAPRAFVFWNFDYHLGTTLDRRGWASIRETLLLAPVAFGLAAASLTRARDVRSPVTAIGAAAFAGVVSQLLLRSSYGEISAPFVPLAALGVGWLRFERANVRVALLAVATLVPLGWMPPRWDMLPAIIDETAQFLRERTSVEARILTPVPIVALSAGRDIVPGLEMGMFAVTDEVDSTALHLVTPGQLATLVAGGTAEAVVMVSQPESAWNFMWTAPSLRRLTPEARAPFVEALATRYWAAHQSGLFTVYLRR